MSEEPFNPLDRLNLTGPDGPLSVNKLEVSSYDDWSSGQPSQDPLQAHLGYGDYLREEYIKNKGYNEDVEVSIQSELGEALAAKGLLTNENSDDVVSQIDAYNEPTLDQKVRDMVAHTSLGQDEWHNGNAYLERNEGAKTPEQIQRLAENALASVNATRNDVLQAKLDAGEISFGRFTDAQGNSFIKAGDSAMDLPLHEALRKSKEAGGGVSLSDAIGIEQVGLLKVADGVNIPRYKMMQLGEVESLIRSELANDDDLSIQLEAIGKRMAERDYSSFDHFEEGFRKRVAQPIRTGLEAVIGVIGGSKPSGVAREKAIDQAMLDDIDSTVMGIAKKFNKNPEDVRLAIQEIAVQNAPLKVFKDKDKLALNIRDDGYGLPFVPIGVKLDDDLFEKSLAARTDLTEATKKAITAERDFFATNHFSNISNILANSDLSKKWLEHLNAGRAAKVSDKEILFSFTSNEDNKPYLDLPIFGDLYLKGSDITRPFSTAFSTVFALSGADWAKKHLANVADDQNNRRELAELFGGKLGMAQDLATLIPEVTVDIAATALLSRFGGRALATKAAAVKAPLYASMTKKGVLKALTTNAFRRGAGESTEQLAEKLASQNLIRSATSKTALEALEAYNKVNLKNLTVGAIGLTAANRSSGATYGTVYNSMLKSGATEEVAHDRALGTGMVAGAVTGLVTGGFSYFGRGGMEDALLSGMSYRNMKTVTERIVQKAPYAQLEGVSDAVFQQAIKESTKAVLKGNFFGKSFVKAGAEEFAEESIDEFINTFVTDAGLEQDTPFFDHLKHSLYAGTLGGILGAGAPAVNAAARRLRPDLVGDLIQDATLEQNLINDITNRLREANSSVTADVVRDILTRDLTPDAVRTPSQEDIDAQELAQQDDSEEVKQQAQFLLEIMRSTPEDQIQEEVDAVRQQRRSRKYRSAYAHSSFGNEMAYREDLAQPVIINEKGEVSDLAGVGLTLRTAEGIDEFDYAEMGIAVEDLPRLEKLIRANPDILAMPDSEWATYDPDFTAEVGDSGVRDFRTLDLTNKGFLTEAEYVQLGRLRDRNKIFYAGDDTVYETMPAEAVQQAIRESKKVEFKKPTSQIETDEFFTAYRVFETVNQGGGQQEVFVRQQYLTRKEAEENAAVQMEFGGQPSVEEFQAKSKVKRVDDDGNETIVDHPLLVKKALRKKGPQKPDKKEKRSRTVTKYELVTKGVVDTEQVVEESVAPIPKVGDTIKYLMGKNSKMTEEATVTRIEYPVVKDAEGEVAFEAMDPDIYVQSEFGKDLEEEVPRELIITGRKQTTKTKIKGKKGADKVLGTFDTEAQAKAAAKKKYPTSFEAKTFVRKVTKSDNETASVEDTVSQATDEDGDPVIDKVHEELLNQIATFNIKVRNADGTPKLSKEAATKKLADLLEKQEVKEQKKELTAQEKFEGAINKVNKLESNGSVSPETAELTRGKILGKRLRTLTRQNKIEEAKKLVADTIAAGKPAYIYNSNSKSLREAKIDEKTGKVAFKKGSRPVFVENIAGEKVFITSTKVNGKIVFHKVGEKPADPAGAGLVFRKRENFVKFLEAGLDITDPSKTVNWAGNVTASELEALNRIVENGLPVIGGMSVEGGRTFGVDTKRRNKKPFYNRMRQVIAERIYNLFPVINVQRPVNGKAIYAQTALTAYSPWEFVKTPAGRRLAAKKARTASLRPTNIGGVFRAIAEAVPFIELDKNNKPKAHKPVAFIDENNEGVFDNDPISMKVLLEEGYSVYFPDDFVGRLNPAFRFVQIGARQKLVDIRGVGYTGDISSVKQRKAVVGDINVESFKKRVAFASKFLRGGTAQDVEIDDPNKRGSKTTLRQMLDDLVHTVNNAFLAETFDPTVEPDAPVESTFKFRADELKELDASLDRANKRLVTGTPEEQEQAARQIETVRDRRDRFYEDLRVDVLKEAKKISDPEIETRIATYENLLFEQRTFQERLGLDLSAKEVAVSQTEIDANYRIIEQAVFKREAIARSEAVRVTQDPQLALKKVQSFFKDRHGRLPLTDTNFQLASRILQTEYANEILFYQLKLQLSDPKISEVEENGALVIKEAQIEKAIDLFLRSVNPTAGANPKAKKGSDYRGLKYNENNKVTRQSKIEFAYYILNSQIDQRVDKVEKGSNYQKVFKNYFEERILMRDGLSTRDRMPSYADVGQKIADRILNQQKRRGGVEKENPFNSENATTPDEIDALNLDMDHFVEMRMGVGEVDSLLEKVQMDVVDIINQDPALEQQLDALLKQGPFALSTSNFYLTLTLEEKWAELVAFSRQGSMEGNSAPIAFLQNIRKLNSPAAVKLHRALRLFNIGNLEFGNKNPFILDKNYERFETDQEIKDEFGASAGQEIGGAVRSREELLNFADEIIDARKYVRWLTDEVRAIETDKGKTITDERARAKAASLHKTIKAYSSHKSFFFGSSVQNAVDRAVAIDSNRRVAVELGLKEGRNDPETIINALKKIATDDSLSESQQNAAKILLLKPSYFEFILDQGGGTYAGMARTKDNGRIEVVLDIAGYNGRGLVDVLLHELFHASLLDSLSIDINSTSKTQRDARFAIGQKIREVREKVGNTTTELTDGLKNVQEFVSNMMNNTKFQDYFRGQVGNPEFKKVVQNLFKVLDPQRSKLRKEFKDAFYDVVDLQGYQESTPITLAGVRQEAVNAAVAEMEESDSFNAAFKAVTGQEGDIDTETASPLELEDIAIRAAELKQLVGIKIPSEIRVVFSTLAGGRVANFDPATNTITFDANNAAIGTLNRGMDSLRAAQMVSKILRHELAHKSAKSALTPEMIQRVIDGSSLQDFKNDIDNYYGKGTPEAEAALARLNDPSKAAREKEVLVQERLADHVERAIGGFSSQEYEAFLRANKSLLGVVSFYFKSFINKFIRALGGGVGQLTADERIAVNRMLVELRGIELGYRAPSPVFNPDATPQESLNRFLVVATGVDAQEFIEDQGATNLLPQVGADSQVDQPRATASTMATPRELDGVDKEFADLLSEADVAPDWPYFKSELQKAQDLFEAQAARITLDSFQQLAHSVFVKQVGDGSILKGQTEFDKKKDEFAKLDPTLEVKDEETGETRTIPNEKYQELKEFFEQREQLAQKMFDSWKVAAKLDQPVNLEDRTPLSERFNFNLNTSEGSPPIPDTDALLKMLGKDLELKSQDPSLDDDGRLYSSFRAKSRSAKDSEFDAFDFNYTELFDQFNLPVLEVGDVEVYGKGFINKIRKFVNTHAVGLLQPEVHHWLKHRQGMTKGLSQELMLIRSKLKSLTDKVYPDGVPVDENGVSLVQKASGSTEGVFISDEARKRIDDQYEADMVAAWTESHQASLDGTEPATKIKADFDAALEAAKANQELETQVELGRRRDQLKAERNEAIQRIAQDSKELSNAIEKLGEFRNKMSEKLQEIHNESGKYDLKIDQNNDIYLTRAYRMFLDVGYADAVRNSPEYKKERDAAIAYFESVHLEIEKKIMMQNNPQMTPTEVESAIRDDMQRRHIGKRALEAFISTYDRGSNVNYFGAEEQIKALVDNLKAKKNIPKELRDILGELKDTNLPDNLLRTIMVVGNMAANQSFLNAVAKAGLKTEDNPDGWLFTEEQIAGVDNPSDYAKLVEGSEFNSDFSPLAGLYAKVNTANAFRETFKRHGTIVANPSEQLFENGFKYFRWLTGLSMGLKTLGSIPFYYRNAIGNVLFFGPMQVGYINIFNVKSAGDLVNAGLHKDFAVNFLKESKRNFLGDKAKLNEYIAKLRVLRLVGDESHTNTFKQLMTGERDIDSTLEDFESIIQGKEGDLSLEGKVSKAIGATSRAVSRRGKIIGTDLAPRMAAAMDSFYKMSMFEFELKHLKAAQEHDRKMNPDSTLAKQTDDQLQKDAAQKVLRTMQSYSQAPPIARAASRSVAGALYAPFVRFQADVIRVMWNTPKIALEEINSGNPILKKRGVQRFSGFVQTAGLASLGLPVLLRTIFGIGDDEDEALKAAGPAWARYNNPLYYKDDNGELQMINFTYTNPFSPVTDSIAATAGAVFNPDATPESAATTLFNSFLVKNFLSDQIFAGAAAEAINGEDMQTGERIFIDGVDKGFDKHIKQLAHIGKAAFAPRTLENVVKAIRNSDGDFTEYHDSPMGLVLNEVNPIRAAFREIPVNPSDKFRSFLFKTEQRRQQIREKFRPLYKDDPLSPEDIFDIYDEVYKDMESLNKDVMNKFQAFEKIGIPKGKLYAMARGSGGGPKLGKRRSQLLLLGYMERPVLSANKVQIMLSESPEMQDRIRVFAEAVKRYPRFSKIQD